MTKKRHMIRMLTDIRIRAFMYWYAMCIILVGHTTQNPKMVKFKICKQSPTNEKSCLLPFFLSVVDVFTEEFDCLQPKDLIQKHLGRHVLQVNNWIRQPIIFIAFQRWSCKIYQQDSILDRAWGIATPSDEDGASNSNDDGNPVDLASGNVILITNMGNWSEKLSEASNQGKIVVVNFSARWCTPCRTIAQSYAELADKYPSIMFLTVDVDELAELSSSWEIKATPTFFFLKDGRQLDKLVGGDKSELLKKTSDILKFAS